MDKVITPQELAQVIREQRFYDIKIIDINEYENVYLGDEYMRLIHQKKVIVNGSDQWVKIIAIRRSVPKFILDNDVNNNIKYERDWEYRDEYHIYKFLRNDLYPWHSPSYTAHSINEILQLLETFNLYKESPLIKKCITKCKS